MISVLHIGLPLTPPWHAERMRKGFGSTGRHQQRMEAVGYRYAVVQASPEGGLTNFREQLRTEPCDAVLIGGGVAADPKLAEFKQQIIVAVRDEAPGAKL